MYHFFGGELPITERADENRTPAWWEAERIPEPIPAARPTVAKRQDLEVSTPDSAAGSASTDPHFYGANLFYQAMVHNFEKFGEWFYKKATADRVWDASKDSDGSLIQATATVVWHKTNSTVNHTSTNTQAPRLEPVTTGNWTKIGGTTAKPARLTTAESKLVAVKVRSNKTSGIEWLERFRKYVT